MSRILCGSLAIISILGLLFIFGNYTADINIYCYTGDSFYIPQKCTNIALLGCTPHPMAYLRKHDDADLKNLTLNDFLDRDYLIDSFIKTFLICNERHIDHLIIAYLPIHFVEIRQLLGNQFISQCPIFLNNIAQEVKQIIEKVKKDVGFENEVTLIIPPMHQLARIPNKIDSFEERVRYLIKQFPLLKNISQSSLTTITVINNKSSDEDDKLIDYLKYEYLFEKSLVFEKCAIGKERFHKEKEF